MLKSTQSPSSECCLALQPDHPCPLCHHPAAAEFHRDKSRTYYRCTRCALLFVDPAERPARDAEKARYDLHQNDPDDPGYRSFLSHLANAIIQATPPTAAGLDFGCGPGPALARMLEESGRSVTLYDPFYVPDESALSRQYDFIAASEVFEHLHRPAYELDRLFAALRPGGVLAVMTSFLPPTKAEFADWYYARDPTHVCFYDHQVFEFIANHWRAAVQFPARNVALLRRQSQL